MALDVTTIKKDFPILERQVHGRRLVYLDSASSSQKPASVIDAMSHYYETTHANVHRGVYTIAEEATRLFEEGRSTLAAFIGAAPSEVVFTKNATEAINLVAYSWGRANLGAGDVVVLTEMEHHANLVPWLMLKAERGIELARTRDPDLIVLDVNLPGMDGFQALELLRSYPDTRHIPIIALSANAMPSEVKRGLEAGFPQYLTKPIDVKEFLRTIDLFLSGSELKSSPPHSVP